MFILSPLHSEIDLFCLCRSKLSFGLGHGFIGTKPSPVLALRQVQRFLISGDSGSQQLLERVLGTKLIVISSEFRLLAESHVLPVSGAGLRGVSIRPHGAADAAPEVWFPGGIER